VAVAVVQVFAMPGDVEHADPTIRYIEADGFWYVIPARKDPAKWQFFQEIYRSKDLKTWEAAPGMGRAKSVGQPLLGPPTKRTAALDKAVAPRAWHPDLHDVLKAMQTKAPAAGAGKNATANWTAWEDCNSSDMDLCEYNNQTVMIFNWGCQHTTEALAVALSPMPLDTFLQGWF
jgi:hypothetical protein